VLFSLPINSSSWDLTLYLLLSFPSLTMNDDPIIIVKVKKEKNIVKINIVKAMSLQIPITT